MYFFIVFLRAIAACLITNSHYMKIYPLSILANGGLLGNIIFFGVSGFCLANINKDHSIRGFIQWYRRRIIRIYPPLFISTAVLLGIGYYKLTDSEGILYWFIYPTGYSFISAIILLYIPFFSFLTLTNIKQLVKKLMILVLLIAMMIYLFFFDKSFYHIDAVEEPFILFLYFESMLLGASFRFELNKYHNKQRRLDFVLLPILTALYFISKIAFSQGIFSSRLQFFNQIIIFSLLYILLRICIELDSVLEMLPRTIKFVISSISKLTLEIYLVQFYIIKKVENMGIAFPVNWIIVSGLIIVAAFLLQCVSNRIIAVIKRKE